MLTLDFNDAELRLFDGEHLLASSPAYAVLDGQDFVLGEAARARARLNPRASYQQFWEQLDQQALNRPAGKANSHADIAYFHLQSLWLEAAARDDQVLLAVAAQYGGERLSLLLGIAQACGLNVQGVCESALLAVAAQGLGDQPVRYLDISRYRLYCTDITAGSNPALAAATELATPGLDWGLEQCVRQIARQFLLETRFDPLHEAASEQRLYDRLPDLLEAVSQSGSVGVTLPAGQREHRIEWRLRDVQAALEQVYRDCENAARDTEGIVLISHRLARLPGLVSRLQAVADCRVQAENALACGVERYREQLRSDSSSPVWVKQLSRVDAQILKQTPPREIHPDSKPSHFLNGHNAFPLADGDDLPGADGVRFVVSSESVHLDRVAEAVLLNDHPYSSDGVLQTGDRISVKGVEFLLIRVESGR